MPSPRTPERIALGSTPEARARRTRRQPCKAADLTVNILTNLAVNTGRITVFGGEQKRPNIHIDDMADAVPPSARRAGSRGQRPHLQRWLREPHVRQIAEMVREVVGTTTAIVATPSDDHRSYHISSEKIRRELGFIPRRSIADAAAGLLAAFRAGRIPDPMRDSRYYNIKTMQNLRLQ